MTIAMIILTQSSSSSLSWQDNRSDDRPGFSEKRSVRTHGLCLPCDHGLTGRALESPSAPIEHEIDLEVDPGLTDANRSGATLREQQRQILEREYERVF